MYQSSMFITLFILGTMFGSFASVLIDRWHAGKGGILFGRSECPKCRKVLTGWELVPLFSYIFQLGKCRGCKVSIPYSYPLLELTMGIVFLGIGFTMDRLGHNITSPIFWFSLFLGWATIIYISYDLLYMEIPDEIMIPAIYICIFFLIFGLFGGTSHVFFDEHTYPTYHTFFFDHINASIILYTFFYFQILIPGGFFLIKQKRIGTLVGLLLSYFTLPLTAGYDVFQKVILKKELHEDILDIPTWIGGGDLRIALFIGITLGSLHGICTFALAYIFGSIVGIGILLLSYFKIIGRKKEIPFGPFLGIGWLLNIIFYNQIIDIIDSIL